MGDSRKRRSACGPGIVSPGSKVLQPLPHRRRVFAEHQRPRHDPVGACLVNLRNRIAPDAAVDLNLDVAPAFSRSRPGPPGSWSKIEASIEVPFVPIGVPTMVT